MPPFSPVLYASLIVYPRPAPASGTSLFGANPTTTTATSGAGLFGKPAGETPVSASGGMFGQPASTTSSTPAQAPLFGKPAPAAGDTAAPEKAAGNLFGGGAVG